MLLQELIALVENSAWRQPLQSSFSYNCQSNSKKQAKHINAFTFQTNKRLSIKHY